MERSVNAKHRIQAPQCVVALNKKLSYRKEKARRFMLFKNLVRHKIGKVARLLLYKCRLIRVVFVHFLLNIIISITILKLNLQAL